MTTVHTKAIQIVLEPIADAIGHMIVLCNEAELSGKGMPDLLETTSNINAAVLNFVQIGREDIEDTADAILKAEMIAACEKAQSATEKVTMAASLLKGDNTSKIGRDKLIEGLQAVLSGTTHILVANDDSEVRMVVEAAINSKNALVLVQEVRTEDDLLAIQEALSRKFITTTKRVNRRIEDLFEQRHKDRMTQQSTIIKGQTPLLFSAMKAKASNSTIASAQINEGLVVKQLNDAFDEIIELVQMRVYLPNWADGTGKIQEKYKLVQAALANLDMAQLDPEEAAQILQDLDTLLHNAEKWLHDPTVSKQHKDALSAKIAEVRMLKKELDDLMAQLVEDPNNMELQRLAAIKKAQLEKAVGELRVLETAAAMEALAHVFADPDLTSKPVVKAAKDQDQEAFVKESKRFMAINKDMNERAKAIAEYIEDEEKAANIRTAVQHNEKVLLPSVIHAGRVVLENPNDAAAKMHLDKMAEQWEAAKNKLEQDVSEAVDPVAFTKAMQQATGKTLEDMRSAIIAQDEPAYLRARHKLHVVEEAAKHARREAANTSDPVMKKMYNDAADQMERLLPKVLEDADAAFAKNDQASLDQFDRSAQELQDAVNLAAEAAYHPIVEAERLAAEAERLAVEKAAAEAKRLAAMKEAERAAAEKAAAEAAAEEAARLAKENEFKPTTAIGETAIGLRKEVNKWDAEGNALVGHALKMTELTKLLGELNAVNDKAGMIKTSKQIAKEANGAAREAMLVCNQCTDKRLQAQLKALAEKLPTQAMQLKIIASVKAANPDDKSADQQLLVCAKALMQTMEEMMRAVDTASIRLTADAKGKEIAASWKKKLAAHVGSKPIAMAKLM